MQKIQGILYSYLKPSPSVRNRAQFVVLVLVVLVVVAVVVLVVVVVVVAAAVVVVVDIAVMAILVVVVVPVVAVVTVVIVVVVVGVCHWFFRCCCRCWVPGAIVLNAFLRLPFDVRERPLFLAWIRDDVNAKFWRRGVINPFFERDCVMFHFFCT